MWEHVILRDLYKLEELNQKKRYNISSGYPTELERLIIIDKVNYNYVEIKNLIKEKIKKIDSKMSNMILSLFNISKIVLYEANTSYLTPKKVTLDFTLARKFSGDINIRSFPVNEFEHLSLSHFPMTEPTSSYHYLEALLNKNGEKIVEIVFLFDRDLYDFVPMLIGFGFIYTLKFGHSLESSVKFIRVARKERDTAEVCNGWSENSWNKWKIITRAGKDYSVVWEACCSH